VQLVSVLCVVFVSAGLSACTALSPSPPPSNDPVTLRVNLFWGASNIPIYMAIDSGAFTRRGITPVLQFTPNSDMQRDGLAAGGDGGTNELMAPTTR
jgi:hypothetical protein